MSDDNREWLTRLLAAVTSHEELVQRLDDAGFESYEVDDVVEQRERFVAHHHRAGVTLRTTHFQGALEPPADYPAGWPFVSDEDATYAESEGDGVSSSTLAWPAPDDPERVWSQVRAWAAELGNCEGASNVTDFEAFVLRKALTLWHHPAHDRFRTLAWYEAEVEGDTATLIVLTEERVYQRDEPSNAG